MIYIFGKNEKKSVIQRNRHIICYAYYENYLQYSPSIELHYHKVNSKYFREMRIKNLNYVLCLYHKRSFISMEITVSLNCEFEMERNSSL